jgi:MFS family permease
MLFRFSLYGFLKNQTYFEPFLFLIFMEKGLSFLQIGLIVALREVIANLMDIPSSALADLYGRRRCMIVSFLVYILSFLILAFGSTFWHILIGIVFFGGGDAFRGGTHKAMILDWLRVQGREAERTKVYGFTRSWSKIGSAVSVLIATGLVFWTSSYAYVFLFATIPYFLNLINLATYPAYLDGAGTESFSLRAVGRHLWSTVKTARKTPPLRRLIAESMCFEGVYGAIKDYLQPILNIAALSLPFLFETPDKKRTALLIGATYFVLYTLASIASRQSHRVVARFKGEENAARGLWFSVSICYAVLLPLLLWHVNSGVIIVFILLGIAQNIWRPILISRIDSHSDPAIGATLLSIESQANSLSTLVVAPVLGFLVDMANRQTATGAEREFWPIAVVGLLACVMILVTSRVSTVQRTTPMQIGPV